MKKMEDTTNMERLFFTNQTDKKKINDLTTWQQEFQEEGDYIWVIL